MQRAGCGRNCGLAAAVAGTAASITAGQVLSAFADARARNDAIWAAFAEPGKGCLAVPLAALHVTSCAEAELTTRTRNYYELVVHDTLAGTRWCLGHACGDVLSDAWTTSRWAVMFVLGVFAWHAAGFLARGAVVKIAQRPAARARERVRKLVEIGDAG